MLVHQFQFNIGQLGREPTRIPAIRPSRPAQTRIAHHSDGSIMALIAGSVVLDIG